MTICENNRPRRSTDRTRDSESRDRGSTPLEGIKYVY